MIQTKTNIKTTNPQQRVHLTTTLTVTDIITNLLFKKNLKNKTLYNCIFINSEEEFKVSGKTAQFARLRVVPHFPSGTVERAKRERA